MKFNSTTEERNKVGQFVQGHSVLEIWKEKSSQTNKGKHYSLLTEFQKGHKTWNKGKRCPYVSEAKKGEKCNFWKGGISPINEIIRKSVEFRLWREAVFPEIIGLARSVKDKAENYTLTISRILLNIPTYDLR